VRFSKKTSRLVSAVSMAIAATLTAKSARGVTLTLYYGQDPSYANSNNSIFVSSTYNPSATTTDAVGDPEYFGPAPTNVSVSQTAPTTILLPVGDYLSLAIDAVLTGDPNPDGGMGPGTGEPSGSPVQPPYLGLAALELGINASGTTSLLGALPAKTGNNVGPYSTAKINVTQGSNGGAYDVVPAWGTNLTNPGNIYSNPVAGGALVSGITGATGGSIPLTGDTSAAVQELEQFAAANNTASYQNATDFMDSLVFQALKPGFETLSPQATGIYWVLSSPGSSTTASTYKTQGFSTSELINPLPSLVIQVYQPGHPVVQQNYPADTADYGAIITNGAGDHQGTFIPEPVGDPQYSSALIYADPLVTGSEAAQVVGINSSNGDSSGIVQVIGGPAFPVPVRNTYYDEYYGIDVQVNGTQASQTQLQTLLNAIDGADGTEPSSCVASLTDPSPDQLLSSLDTATTDYNLFLTFTTETSYYSGYLELDLSNLNDPNLVGYTFTAIAVVPEPASAAILFLGLGLLSRRRQRA
jgi:hypothetical protein